MHVCKSNSSAELADHWLSAALHDALACAQVYDTGSATHIVTDSKVPRTCAAWRKREQLDF